MDVDPRKLAVLLAVHRAGGILAAADVLHLTPSAVSQQIARLEAEIGTPVLDRQPHGAVVTAAGRVLTEAAERIESELTDVTRSLAALREEVSGTVVIAAFQTVIRALLVPLVHQLRSEFPGLELRIHEMDGDKAQQELRAGTVDLLIVEAETPIGRRSARGTRDVPILEEPWVVVTPAGTPAPTTLTDLEHLTWLGVDADAAAHDATEHVRRGMTLARTAHSYYDYNAALALVAGGLGVAVVPSLAVHGMPLEGVKAVSVPGLGSRRLIARHRTSRAEPRKEVATVLDGIIRAAAELPSPTA
ncbi:LysR family transcriptional regulator [Streptomyces sp. NPDC002795]|uniref:LysR family transcriptional regulator n=1 Tax=Streptomyces sp. NPDC002795 TaxID=3364665 RepID=UPI0036CD2B68